MGEHPVTWRRDSYESKMHIVIDLSSHGFGHAGMTAPIIMGLLRVFPGITLTVRSELPEHWLRRQLPIPFSVAPPPPDPAVIAISPFQTDPTASALIYDALFSRWDSIFKEEVSSLRDLEPDLVLANVPFLSLCAANALGVPAVAISPLNWADIYKAYCWERPNGPRIYLKILAAYQSATVFLQPSPSMPMENLSNRYRIGPVARVGDPQRETLTGLFAQEQNERFVLVSFGGIKGRPAFQLPQISGVRWFVPDDYENTRCDITRRSVTGLVFIDLLASCDVVVTKPGYGLFVEAACNGVKVAYVPRPDWPEVPYLIKWLDTNWVARNLGHDAFFEGNIKADIQELLSSPTPQRLVPTGVEDALGIISELLGHGKTASDLVSS